MSKYTTELRYICESKAGKDESVGYTGIDEVLTEAAPIIFDFDYPIFDSAYKLPLEKKILKHYYTREISEETYGLWKLRLDARMNEIMPYYNQLYLSEMLHFNPLYDFDYTKSGQRSGEKLDTGTITDNVTRDSDIVVARSRVENASGTEDGYDRLSKDDSHWDMYSDTPQGGLLDIASNSYLTNARHITDNDFDTTVIDRETTSSGTDVTNGTDTVAEAVESVSERDLAVNNTEDYVEHVMGKMPGKSYGQMLIEFRNSMINIDMMIIENLSDLFFGLWE